MLVYQRVDGGFHKGPPIAGCFIMENAMEMDDEMGYPYFRKLPYDIIAYNG
jgi:hypothetical protein